MAFRLLAQFPCSPVLLLFSAGTPPCPELPRSVILLGYPHKGRCVARRESHLRRPSSRFLARGLSERTAAISALCRRPVGENQGTLTKSTWSFAWASRKLEKAGESWAARSDGCGPGFGTARAKAPYTTTISTSARVTVRSPDRTIGPAAGLRDAVGETCGRLCGGVGRPAPNVGANVTIKLCASRSAGRWVLRGGKIPFSAIVPPVAVPRIIPPPRRHRSRRP